MDVYTAGAIIIGVVGTQIIVRIVWRYLENRKNNPGASFEILSEKLSGLEKRLIDKLNEIHEDLKELKK